jgi:hypothetical protein
MHHDLLTYSQVAGIANPKSETRNPNLAEPSPNKGAERPRNTRNTRKGPFRAFRVFHVFRSSSGLQPFCVRFKKNEEEQIQTGKIGKAQNGEREIVFDIAASDFGLVSDFGFRASDLGPKSGIVKWLCLFAGLVVLSTPARAQYDPDWLFHVRAGGLMGLNIKANFSTSGPLNLAENLPAGVYDDGYVRTDQTGNAGGLTSFWGYQNASQVNPDNHTLLMHQTTTFSATTSGSGNDSPYFGAEVAGGGNFWRKEHWRIGWELGCGVLPISIKNQQNLPVNVNRNLITFDTGDIVVPTAPYNGGPSGIGPLINATGTMVGSETLAGTFSGTQTLEATLVAIKLGPTFFWDLSRYVGLQAGVGPAIGVVPGTLKFEETIQLSDGTAPHSSGKVSSTEVTFGGYVNVVATVHVGKNADLYLGGQYLPLGNVSFGGNGRNADLKLDGQINFMAGINWPF